MPPFDAVRYRIQARSPEAHLYQVSCTVQVPNPGGQRFEMAAWTPGSYHIRDFAKNVVSIQAESAGKAVRLEKLDKQTWRAAPAPGPLTVTCEIYAGELSVRTSHLDSSHGFIDGASLLPRAVGHETAPCLIELLPPEDDRYRNWQVATTLPRRKASHGGFGLYEASDYHELLDHPVEMGEFAAIGFEVLGVPHELCITGRQSCDTRRLAADLKTLCEHHARFFGGLPPLERYAFLITVGEDERMHGLEHRASAALACNRDALPAPGAAATEGYRRFLRLCSHEYFHLWNGKRIAPHALTAADLGREAYTRQLWAFEGMTSYYGDIALARSGLIRPQALLDLLGQALTGVMHGTGRLRQTLEDASFDAWIKTYQPDENAANALVSYYNKGELVALALDLLIRERTRGARSLDDVMRALWERHGREAVPLPEQEIESIASEISGLPLRRFFDLALRSMRDLPLSRLLATVGISVQARFADTHPGTPSSPRKTRERERRVQLGADTAHGAGQVSISRVFDGGLARAAGLAAGDVLVALDNLRITPGTLSKLLARYEAGNAGTFHYFRRGELRSTTFVIPRAGPENWVLSFQANAGAEALIRRRAWLGG